MYLSKDSYCYWKLMFFLSGTCDAIQCHHETTDHEERIVTGNRFFLTPRLVLELLIPARFSVKPWVLKIQFGELSIRHHALLCSASNKLPPQISASQISAHPLR